MCKTIIILIFFTALIYSQKIDVLESSDEYIKLSIKFDDAFEIRDTTVNSTVFQYINQKKPAIRKPGDPWLPAITFNLGLPSDTAPEIQILSDINELISNKFILPFPDTDQSGETEIFIPERKIYSSSKYFPDFPVMNAGIFKMRFASVISIEISPFQFNPIQRTLLFHKEIIVKVTYKRGLTRKIQIKDKLTDRYLSTSVLNYEFAKKWIIDSERSHLTKAASASQWYNPEKTYWKLYLNKKGLYRITFDQLRAAGFVSEGKLPVLKVELFNNGIHIPIYVSDDDGFFNEGDYIQFIGAPPKNSPYTKQNLYNNQNVYWLSFQADSTGLQYTIKNGYPDTWQGTYSSSVNLIHYEVDSLYERLGLADNDQRDYWFWGKASGQNKNFLEVFSTPFTQPPGIIIDSSKFRLRVNLHGMTDNTSIFPDHNAQIMLTSQPIGNITWDGQEEATFETEFDIREKAIFPDVNNLQVVVKADIPADQYGQTSDEIRINWFELEYWREHRANSNYFSFTSPPGITGKNRFSVFSWTDSTMNVYIPDKNIILNNVQNTNNVYREWLFNDDVISPTEYFCVSDEYFISPDSIIKNNNSDLRNTANAADYIIISHPDFTEAAKRLNEYRSSNLTGFDNPRVKTVFINDIYNEFSNGLADPYALRDFVKYSVENWQKPVPSYIVLLGDMSWDYRGRLKNSRKNYIPSIPYHSDRYGQAVSDNIIVSILGDDVIPDLAIGRLSCETPLEANILIDKIINYKSETSKQWKEKVLLIGAGESNNDESFFGFNDENVRLERGYISPAGYSTTKIFRYPNRPEHQLYLGERPQIREAFNEGCVIANFYGHGGGYQWDFVFLNDDIYLLRNENRMPVVLSITCYTAHFDNQDVFGEQFNKVSGKGSIGFWGHTGITLWVYGVDLNNKLFEQIFTNGEFVIGDAILFAKGKYQNASKQMKDHVALLTYLGDPALELALPKQPDFRVASSEMSVSPEFPQVNDTVLIKVNIDNWGSVFPNDSVSVELKAALPDTSYLIGFYKIKSFGNRDSLFFQWVPSEGGNYTLRVEVNEKNIIPEIDHLDNSAEINCVVYNLSEPYVIKPFNGYSGLLNNDVEFLIADIGYYISKNLIYYIEIDTSIYFTNPINVSEGIAPVGGLGRWRVNLSAGKYFWRTRLSDNNQFSKWSSLRTFSVSDSSRNGYFITDEQLKLFTLNNIDYDESAEGLTLNTSLLPPRPDNIRFVEDIKTDIPDTIKGLSALTTDGTYLYIGHMAYYGGLTLIYKMGTGYNGTEKGKIYGLVSGSAVRIWHQMFYHNDGNIYIPTGKSHYLLSINTKTGDTASVYIPAGMLNSTTGKVQNGAFYLSSDGTYVYNLSYIDSTGMNRYKIRVFDPAHNWRLVDEINPLGTSYMGFCGFFVAHNNCYPYENVTSGFMRRIDLQSKVFEEEWLTFKPYQGFYAWTYDWVNDVVYASVYRSGFETKISKFAGGYKEAKGSIVTQEIGPAAEWDSIEYNLETEGSSGSAANILEGYNVNRKTWDTLAINIPEVFDLTGTQSRLYSKIRMLFTFSDSSFGAGEPIRLTSLNVKYKEPADLSVIREEMVYTPDSLLQGLPITLNIRIRNNGYTESKDAAVYLYLDDDITPVHRNSITVPPDTFKDLQYQFNTEELYFTHKIKLKLAPVLTDIHNFNNYAEREFYINRDSINPIFNITFDGVEILNGDVVSASPEIVMTLSDNSPLPLADTSRFFIFYNNSQLSFRDDSLTLSSIPFPNSQAVIRWNPVFENGTHFLEVLAKDASGNFFDTTSYSITFDVNNLNNLYNIYNYPNPFQDETFFTFTLTGMELPEEFFIKIYTVAGRLVREIKVPVSELRFGFNKIYYNGRDQDGNTLANGVYFSKFVVKHKNNSTSFIQKLAKIK